MVTYMHMCCHEKDKKTLSGQTHVDAYICINNTSNEKGKVLELLC